MGSDHKLLTDNIYTEYSNKRIKYKHHQRQNLMILVTTTLLQLRRSVPILRCLRF